MWCLHQDSQAGQYGVALLLRDRRDEFGEHGRSGGGEFVGRLLALLDERQPPDSTVAVVALTGQPSARLNLADEATDGALLQPSRRPSSCWLSEDSRTGQGVSLRHRIG
jgi:hypothetical protein